MSTPTIATTLAAHRLQGFLASVSTSDSDQELVQKIALSRHIVSSFTMTGPAYDLPVLLRDPNFTLPGRSRQRTERIVSEGRRAVDDLMRISAEYDRQRSTGWVKWPLLLSLVLIGTPVALLILWQAGILLGR